jgi:hypothetical protein
MRDEVEELALERFVTPENLELAEAGVSRLVSEIKDIERDLPGKTVKLQRLGAICTLEVKVATLRLLKGWITDERNRLRAGVVSGEPLDPSDPKSLLRRALFILRDWAPTRAHIKDEEWAVVNAVERYVMRK